MLLAFPKLLLTSSLPTVRAGEGGSPGACGHRGFKGCVFCCYCQGESSLPFRKSTDEAPKTAHLLGVLVPCQRLGPGVQRTNHAGPSLEASVLRAWSLFDSWSPEIPSLAVHENKLGCTSPKSDPVGPEQGLPYLVLKKPLW